MVAGFVWAGTALFIAPSLLFWSNTYALMSLALLFPTGHVWVYGRLARWRAPA